MNKNEHDGKQRYCPMLGHHLTFKYCRTTDSDKLCRKIKDCWFDKIDIEKFISANYNEEELNTLKKQKQPKIVSIYEIMKQAQERSKQNKD